jgi:2-dehydropantoate 2-reductase
MVLRSLRKVPPFGTGTSRHPPASIPRRTVPVGVVRVPTIDAAPRVPVVASVAVVGPGSVGTFFAAHLAAAGHDVVCCARRPFAEYVVESPDSPVTGPARVVTDPAEVAGAGDVVLLTVKAHQTAGAAGWLAALCGPDTAVLVGQNGIEHRERVEPLVGSARVVPTVVYCGAELLAPGHVRHYAHGVLLVETVPEVVAAAFTGSAARVRAVDDWTTEAWRKLGTNVVANGITALTLRPMSVLREPDVAALARGLVSECWSVARAEGASLAEDDVATMIELIGNGRGDGGTSMLYDRRAGRATEYDAIHGAVLRYGDRHGIDTPLVRAVHALLGAIEPG